MRGHRALQAKGLPLSGELVAAIKLQTGVFQEFGGKSHVLGAVDATEPRAFPRSVAGSGATLRVSSLPCQTRRPGNIRLKTVVAEMLHPHPDAIFAILVLFNAAAVVVARLRSTSCHGFNLLRRRVSCGPNSTAEQAEKDSRSKLHSQTQPIRTKNRLPGRTREGKGVCPKI